MTANAPPSDAERDQLLLHAATRNARPRLQVPHIWRSYLGGGQRAAASPFTEVGRVPSTDWEETSSLGAVSQPQQRVYTFNQRSPGLAGDVKAAEPSRAGPRSPSAVSNKMTFTLSCFFFFGGGGKKKKTTKN